MKSLTISILTTFILYSGRALCQSGRSPWQQPVVRHSPASTLPDTLAITGRVVAVWPGYCGYFCSGGTAKIRLIQPIDGYSSRFVFVVTACLSEADTSRLVSVKASKLRQQEKECYYTSISNGLSSQVAPFSQPLPFYKLSEWETRKLEQDERRRK